MYAKINGTTLITYPYSLAQFLEDNPYTNYKNDADIFQLFPETDLGKQGFSVVNVVNTVPPNATYEQNVIEKPPILINDVWTQVWEVVQASADEILERTTEQANNIRSFRNSKLFKSDWTQLSDTPLTNKSEWVVYRQALRDLTKESGFPWNITWPTDPTGVK